MQTHLLNQIPHLTTRTRQKNIQFNWLSWGERQQRESGMES